MKRFHLFIVTNYEAPGEYIDSYETVKDAERYLTTSYQNYVGWADLYETREDGGLRKIYDYALYGDADDYDAPAPVAWARSNPDGIFMSQVVWLPKAQQPNR